MSKYSRSGVQREREEGGTTTEYNSNVIKTKTLEHRQYLGYTIMAQHCSAALTVYSVQCYSVRYSRLTVGSGRLWSQIVFPHLKSCSYKQNVKHQTESGETVLIVSISLGRTQ